MVNKCIVQFVAELARPHPTPDSKFPCQGLSESVVSFSGTFYFMGEQYFVCNRAIALGLLANYFYIYNFQKIRMSRYLN